MRGGQPAHRRRRERRVRRSRWTGPTTSPRSRSSGSPARKAAPRSPRCCSATPIPGGRLPLDVPARDRRHARVHELSGRAGQGALRRERVRRLPLVRPPPHRAALRLRSRPLVHDVRCSVPLELDRTELGSTARVELRIPVTQHRHARRHRGRAVLRARRPEATVARPEQELRAFAKVALDPGQSATVVVVLDRRAFAFWDPDRHDWVVEPGEFEIRIGVSSRDIRAVAVVTVATVPAATPAARRGAFVMRAALLTAAQEPLEVVDDIEIESPRAGEVIVRVSHCGVCHSDLSNVDGTFPAPVPMVLGHEAAGTVEEIGPGVDIAEARRPGGARLLHRRAAVARSASAVVSASVSTAPRCSPARSTTVQHAALARRAPRCTAVSASVAFGELVITQESGAIKVDDDTPLEIACVIGCAIQTGVGAVLNTAKVEAGDTVLVLGLGGVGIAIVQGARIAGASRIIVSDPVSERRDAAARFGATDAIDPTVEDVVGAGARAHRYRCRLRVRGGREGRARSGCDLGDSPRRHGRARRCRAARRRDHHRARRRLHGDRTAARRLVPREQQLAPRDPAAACRSGGRGGSISRAWSATAARSRKSTRRSTISAPRAACVPFWSSESWVISTARSCS